MTIIRVAWPFFIVINNFANGEPVLRLVEPCLRQGQPIRLYSLALAIAFTTRIFADTLLMRTTANGHCCHWEKVR